MGQSVAEHSPRELVGECVPTLNPLVLVLQAVKPVLQALALGIDAQNHSTYERGQRGSQGFSDLVSGLSFLPSYGWTFSGFQPQPAHLTQYDVIFFPYQGPEQSGVVCPHLRD